MAGERQATAGNMRAAALEKFGEDLDTLIPRLIAEYKTPYLVAMQLGVYANAVRAWLIRRGWRYVDGQWQQVESQADPV